MVRGAYGVAFRSVAVLVRNNRGNIASALRMGVNLETQVRLMEMANTLASLPLDCRKPCKR